MKILLEESKELEYIYEDIVKQNNVEVIKGNITELYNLKTKGDILFIYCNTTDDIKKYKKFKGVNILVVTKNTSTIFVYSLLQIIHPIDVICLNTNKVAISARIKSNLDMLKGGKYEEDYMFNNDSCYC